jgi:hypothetical protein
MGALAATRLGKNTGEDVRSFIPSRARSRSLIHGGRHAAILPGLTLRTASPRSRTPALTQPTICGARCGGDVMRFTLVFWFCAILARLWVSQIDGGDGAQSGRSPSPRKLRETCAGSCGSKCLAGKFLICFAPVPSRRRPVGSDTETRVARLGTAPPNETR